MDKKEIGLIFFLSIYIIVYTIISYMSLYALLNYVPTSEISENTSYTNKVGLYKELNDCGLSNETYVMVNNSFEVVKIG